LKKVFSSANGITWPLESQQPPFAAAAAVRSARPVYGRRLRNIRPPQHPPSAAPAFCGGGVVRRDGDGLGVGRLRRNEPLDDVARDGLESF